MPQIQARLSRVTTNLVVTRTARISCWKHWLSPCTSVPYERWGRPGAPREGGYQHERARRVRRHPGLVARRHARRCPLAGHLRPHRRGLRPDRKRPHRPRRPPRRRPGALRRSLLPWTTPRRPGARLPRKLLSHRRAGAALPAAARQPRGARQEPVDGRRSEDLAHLQRHAAPDRRPGQPERPARRAGRLLPSPGASETPSTPTAGGCHGSRRSRPCSPTSGSSFASDMRWSARKRATRP